MRNIVVLLIFAVALALQAGCGGGGPHRPSDLPKLHPVNITITQGGTPLEGATVNLTSKTPATYGTATGATDSSGVAAMRTYGFTGVPEGQYTVTVMKTAIEGATEQMDGNAKILVGGRIYQYVDAQYQNAETSTLSIDIKAGTTNETLDVGAPVKEFIAENLRD